MDALGLDIFSPRTTGRAQKHIEVGETRPLVAADLVLLEAEGKGSKPSPIKRLSDRHHALARALSAGKTTTEAAAIVGMDVSRVSILKADPTFKELLVFYRDNVDAEYMAMHEQLAGLGKDALRVLRDRLELEDEDGREAPEFSAGQLLEIVKTSTDRTGYGPSSTSTNVNVNVDLASRLEAARKRAAQRTIEHDGEKDS